jgi:hypothetical protein
MSPGSVRDDAAYRPDPADLLGLAKTKEKRMARFVMVHGRILRRMDLVATD